MHPALDDRPTRRPVRRLQFVCGDRHIDPQVLVVLALGSVTC
jgi:hypothetical protein